MINALFQNTANWAEKNAVYKLIISFNKYKLTAIILN
jgi:hypothetical protein